MSSPRIDILSRLLLTKVLYTKGAAACSATKDKQTFALGLLQLQDAIELALGALGDHVGASLPDPIRFHDYFDRINEKIAPKKLTYRRDLLALNSVRVSLKHRGLLPDIGACAHFPSVVLNFLSAICEEHFALDFSMVSLRDAVREDNARHLLVAAEDAIEHGEFDVALEFMATAWYRAFEQQYVVGLARLSGQAPKEINFPELDLVDLRLNLIEKGIDPFLYFRFRNLTPRIGTKTDTGELVTRWETHDYGHAKNWTEQNARFCYGFVVDALIKLQGESTGEYTLVHYAEAYFDKVEPSGDSAVLYEDGVPPHLAGSTMTFGGTTMTFAGTGFGKRAGRVSVTLQQGQYILGWARRDDETPMYSVVLPGTEFRVLFVESAAVTLSSIPREETVKAPDGTFRLREA